MSKNKNTKKIPQGQQKKLWLRIVMGVMAVVLLLSIIMSLVMPVSAAEDEGSVTVTSFDTGNLSAALTEAMDGVDRNNIKRVSISGGTLSQSDYTAICDMPNLEFIELAGAETEKGIVPDNALPARNQLTYISLPSNTKVIGNSAFNNNKKLVKVSMPNTVLEIGSYAFDSCIALTDITVPAGVTSIGDGAFRECQSLAVFTLPAGVTEIPAYCFSKCIFTEFYIGPQVTYIGEGAFADCHELKDLYIYGENAPELGGGGVFQNLNVTVHTADDADGYDGWGNNFVSTEDGFNEEYKAPETAAPVTEAAEETEKAEEKEEKSEEAETETEKADETEKEEETKEKSEEKTSESTEEKSDNGFSGISVIVIAVLAAALAVTITLLVIKSKK